MRGLGHVTYSELWAPSQGNHVFVKGQSTSNLVYKFGVVSRPNYIHDRLLLNGNVFRVTCGIRDILEKVHDRCRHATDAYTE